MDKKIFIILQSKMLFIWTYVYPGTTSFLPPKKYFMLFYLLSSPIVLAIALYYLSGQEQQI